MRIVLAGLVLVLAIAEAHAADPTPKARFDAAVVEAKANLSTPEGKAYDVVLSKHFEEHSGPVLTNCFKTTRKPDASPLELVFVLSADGKPRDILVSPETNIAKCFIAQLRTTSLPAPPKDGYLAYLVMRFAK